MSAPGGNGVAPGGAADRRALLAARLQQRIGAAADGPVSPGQRSLWFLHALAPDSASLNIAFAARVVSHVDADALRAAFQALVARHPALRTVFPVEAGVPSRRVLPTVAVPFDRVDVAGWSDAQILDAVTVSVETPFDLQAGPLVRVRLFTTQQGATHLAVSFHHIVMDGWSLWLCLSQLADHYAAAVSGEAPPAPAGEDGFARYIRAQLEMVDGPEGARHLAFWRDRVAREAAPLALPTDFPRPARPAFKGESVRFRLGEPLTRQLRHLARDHRCTVQMVVLAVFQALLHRYSGQEAITVGYLASGRAGGGADDVVGYLANPLPLQSCAPPGLTFSDLLRRTRDDLLDALEHEAYPFPLIVQHLAPHRDAGRPPIFQVLFVFEKPQRLEDQQASAFAVGDPGARMQLGPLVLESLPLSAQREGQFDLTLVLAERGDDLVVSLDYRTELFERATIERCAGHLRTLAAHAGAEPQRDVGALDLLPPSERAALLAAHATARPYPDGPFHALVARWAASDPDAVAVVFDGEALTYAQLDRRAGALARALRDSGLAVGARVGLCVERSLDLIVAVLGILKAGGAFVPLDARYPEDRRAYMLADSQASTLVTTRALLDHFPAYQGRCLCVDDLAADDTGAGVDPRVGAHDLAYVIYTSGSTGRPKGVLLEHGGLVNVAQEQQRLFGVGPGSQVLQFASISFDASVFEIAMALGAGATLHMARPDALLPGEPLLKTLRERAISVVTLPPSALAALPVAPLPDLKVITVAGEACGAELVARWAPGRAFFNLYGPTETTIWATAARCMDGSVTPTIGRGIANTDTYVLDDRRQLVPRGVAGELYLGGVGLARGYHNQPELTAAAFVPNPFGPAGSRLYKTGDRARWLHGGDLEFLGRVDHQVKVRGFRVELGEIEALLHQHPDVDQAVAVVRGAPASQLAAYVTVRDGATASPRTLRAFLRAGLPEFMVPSFVVCLEAFPLSPSGKIDRGRLPAPDPRAGGDEGAAPSTALEAAVAAVWAEVLQVARVGADDNFFDLGGTSLLVAQLHARLNALAPSVLSMVDLFQWPTVRAQAARLHGGGPPDDGAAVAAEAMLAGRERLKALASRRAAAKGPR